VKIIRRARASWRGPVPTGSGTMGLGRSGEVLPFSLRSRTEDDAGTNPEELLGAAHAGCFSMSLSDLLEGAGHPATEVTTTARVTMEEKDGAFTITTIDLVARGQVEGIDEETFRRLAQQAKETCPDSKLFSSAKITLDAALG
jgi:osmotically inducible protein OsmC